MKKDKYKKGRRRMGKISILKRSKLDRIKGKCFIYIIFIPNHSKLSY